MRMAASVDDEYFKFKYAHVQQDQPLKFREQVEISTDYLQGLF